MAFVFTKEIKEEVKLLPNISQNLKGWHLLASLLIFLRKLCVNALCVGVNRIVKFTVLNCDQI